MKCKECGKSLGFVFDYDSFCYMCALNLMNEGPGFSNYEEASAEYWRAKFKQDAIDTPPFWKTPIDPASGSI
jgi:hypothetical protein